MRSIFSALLLAPLLCGLGPVASCAESAVAFKGLRSGADKPVEITADQLQVSQTDGQAVFTGNVVVVQGDLHLSTDKLLVDYVKGDKTKIDTLHADGHVLMATPTEAAEAEAAVYSLTDGQLRLTGNVLLNQAGSTISGQTLNVDLNTGIGHMDGRVKTVLQPKGN